MTFLELFVFVAFLGFICWLAWRTYLHETKVRHSVIKKEQRQTELYERLLSKLEECEDCYV